ncbi:MAG: S8 family serine peptidase [Flavobacteriaceae bacterium]
MDCKIPIWATGIFLSLLFSILSISSVFGQSKLDRDVIQITYDQHKIGSFVSKMNAEYQSKEIIIDQILKSNNWKRTERLSDGTIVSLNDIGSDGTPLFYTTLNDPSNQVSRAHTLYAGGLLNLGLDGNGMQVGVWDAGVPLKTHQEFDVRVINGDGTEEVGSHATLVTGNLISSGIKPNAKGVAYSAEVLAHNWTRDKIEVAEAAANGLLLSNHSYGIKSDRVPDWYFGSYIKVSQDWDKIMFNAPYYLMVTAAGNAQKSYDNEAPIFGKTSDGFDLLLGFATSKNGLTIAGANTKIDGKGELQEARVASYSSMGPVDDGRIKPDLAGDGSSIFSTSSTTNTSYDSSTGTSMAAPGVTGSLLLLQQYHKELYGGFMKAATLKGLALHTADDVDVLGPDYKMGWGIMNAMSAAEVIQSKDYSSLIEEKSLENGETFSITIDANGKETLFVSLSWTDPEGEYINRGDLNGTTLALMNDLDIRITKNGDTHYPWKLNAAKVDNAATRGDNKVDPFERIEVENAKGTYTITITHKGTLVNGFQDFSLLVSGAQISKCTVDIPEDIDLLSATENGATIAWSMAEETLFEVHYKSTLQNNWNSELLWENSLELSNLEKGVIYEARIRSICTENIVSGFSEEIQFEFNGTESELIPYEPFAIDEALQITVYPNPTTEWLTVDAKLSEDAVYSVITTSGNTIKKGKPTEAINVSELSSGLYVLVVQDHSGIKSSKFYKN